MRLRVTDNGGATDLAVRTLTIIDNQPPTAAFTVDPNPVIEGEPVSFNGSGSSDPDGTIAKYEWDLDGNGSYETDTRLQPDDQPHLRDPGHLTVGLRVTDNGGKTATTTAPVSVKQRRSQQLPRRGARHPRPRSLLADGRDQRRRPSPTASARSPATAVGDADASACPAASPATPTAAAALRRRRRRRQAPVNLSGTHAGDGRVLAEVEHLRQRRSPGDGVHQQLQRQRRRLPDRPERAPQLGGSFGVGIGTGDSATTPSSTARAPASGTTTPSSSTPPPPPAQQITPYVDGKAVAYTKLDSGTGAGNFANSTLYFMSRGAASPVRHRRPRRGRDLQPRPRAPRRSPTLPAATAPTGARWPPSPVAAQPGRDRCTVTFNASGSDDPDGTIAKYEWDLDGNGDLRDQHRLDADGDAHLRAEGELVSVGLRVTDNLTGTDTTTRTLNVAANAATDASFTVNPNPAVVGQPSTSTPRPPTTPTARSSSTSGTSTATAATRPTPARRRRRAHLRQRPATINVGLRVTDDGGRPPTTTVPLTVKAGGVSSYPTRCSTPPAWSTTGASARRAGPTFADSAGTEPRHRLGRRTLGVPGASPAIRTPPPRFDGVDDAGQRRRQPLRHQQG